jgi:hypothetical protein
MREPTEGENLSSEMSRSIYDLLETFKANAVEGVDPRVKSIVITKLEEAMLWVGILPKQE